ncbi:MAG: rhmT [Firmicutes bacterium]|nr:rhmT [Bacillota bacterium]
MASMINRGLATIAMDKAQRRILPFILLMYVLAFLDRANIGFAKQAFQLDTGLSNAAYAMGAGIFFIGYAVVEVPSNIAMYHFGARVWLARIMITWGIVAASFAWLTTEPLFLTGRFLLGVCEAGFFPGIIYYLTNWFTAEKRGTVTGLFYAGAPLSFVFGSPLSGILLDLNGMMGFHGWQWMFVVEGLLASIVGVWALFYLDDKPSDAKWLNNDEKIALNAAIDEENANKPKGHASAWKILGNPKVLYLALIYCTVQISVYGFTFYLPSQVASLLGVKVGTMVGLVSAIPWICALIATAIIPKYSDRSGKRGVLAAILMVCGGLGLYGSATNSPIIGLIGLSVAISAYITVQPVFWTIPTQFLHGVAAASAIALINAVGNLGGFIAPNLRAWAEQAFNSPSAGLFAIASASFLGAILLFAAIPMGMGKNEAPKDEVAQHNHTA